MSHLNNNVSMNGVNELGNLFLSVTGGAVYYVGSATQIANMTPDVGQGITGRTYTSVNAALLQCVSGRGDIIYLLPGYTESIATADAWSGLGTITDVTIIGMGHGTNRPTLTWTTATSTVLFDSANFRLLNCNLYLAGAHAAGAALTVAAPITVSAAGCEISDCAIFWGFDADQGVTIGVTTTAAADFMRFNRNYCYAETAAGALATAFFYAVGADYLQMYDCMIEGATSATTVGVLRFITTASLGIDIRRCAFRNLKAASIHAVTQMAGVLGVVQDCTFGILDDATKAGWVPAGAGDGPQFARCFTANLAGENGTATTPIST